MNKGEFIREMAFKANIKQTEAAVAYEAFIATIEDALRADDNVVLLGFGRFGVKNKPARTCVNPQTQETVNIPACKVPTFKFGKNFKNLIN